MKSYPTKFKSFPWKIVQMVAKFHTNPYNFLACLPNPFKLSILGDICRATILPFSSSKYFYSWLRLENIVDLSSEYLSFSNKRKTTILFPSPLTFLSYKIALPRFVNEVCFPPNLCKITTCFVLLTSAERSIWQTWTISWGCSAKSLARW